MQREKIAFYRDVAQFLKKLYNIPVKVLATAGIFLYNKIEVDDFNHFAENINATSCNTVF